MELLGVPALKNLLKCLLRINCVKLFSLFVLLSFTASVAAAEAASPKDIGASKVFLQLNWSIDFGEAALPGSFTLKTFGFPTTQTQKARMEPGGRYGYEEKRDSLGNTVLEFSFSPSQRKELADLRSFVDVDFTAGQTAQDDGSGFLGESGLTKPSVEIASKAAELKAKAKNDLEAIVLLTEYVHNRVRYDGPGYGTNVQTAQWVFANQVGTCDEYSHLLVSMLRSQGIPAKFAAGFVCSVNCTQSRNWGPHAWVEALAGGEWVNSDPTFNEAILLDATHVKFAEGRDQNDIKETLSALAFNYELSNVKIERSADVSLDEWKPFAGLFELALKAPSETLGEASVATVVAEAKSVSAKPIAVPLSIVVPTEAKVIGAEDGLVFLTPGASAKREWKIALPKELKEGFVYNFTVKASSLSQTAEAHLVAKKGGASAVEESVSISDFTPRLEPDGVLVIEIEVLNNGGKDVKNARVTLETNAGGGEQALSLPAGRARKLSFTLQAPPASIAKVEGKITVDTGTLKLDQPITVDLGQRRPQEGTQAGGQPQATGDFFTDLINAILSFLLSLLGGAS